MTKHPKSPLDPYLPYLPYIILLIIIVAGGIGSYLYIQSQKPPQGTWRYGVCRAFAETYLRYPETMRVNHVIEKSKQATLTISHLNAHGFRPTRVFRCEYEQKNGRIQVKEIRVDRDRLSPDEVKKFSDTLPILLNDPDLNLDLPKIKSHSLLDLKPTDSRY